MEGEIGNAREEERAAFSLSVPHQCVCVCVFMPLFLITAQSRRSVEIADLFDIISFRTNTINRPDIKHSVLTGLKWIFGKVSLSPKHVQAVPNI